MVGAAVSGCEARPDLIARMTPPGARRSGEAKDRYRGVGMLLKYRSYPFRILVVRGRLLCWWE